MEIATNTEHPVEEMELNEVLEMQLEWEELSEKMKLRSVLEERGYEFSRKMFVEAYSIALAKGKRTLSTTP